jgi:hypothetical protein
MPQKKLLRDEAALWRLFPLIFSNWLTDLEAIWRSAKIKRILSVSGKNP